MTKNLSDYITLKFQNFKINNMEMAISRCVFYESPDIYLELILWDLASNSNSNTVYLAPQPSQDQIRNHIRVAIQNLFPSAI